jgi:hypothetical protein
MQYEIPAYFGLIAAVIGAVAAITGQYFSSFLTSKRDRRKMKMELIAEERCLAYLLSQYYGVFIGEIILSAMNLRLASMILEEDSKANNSSFYKSANEALDRAQEIDEKIRITSANYYKVITHFTYLTKKEEIISLFESLKTFEKPIFTFAECKNTNDLSNAREKETKRLNEAYKLFPDTYEKIHEVMHKSK